MTRTDEYKLILDKYPHIADKLNLAWGYPEFPLVVNRLLTDTRDDTRQGFPPEIGQALMRILALYYQKFPHRNINSSNIWEQ